MSFTPSLPSADNLLLGAGALYFDRFENGQKTGERHLGNITSFTTATSDDVKEKYSSMNKSRGLYKAANVKRTITLKLTGDEYSVENVALNVMGDVVNIVQSATTVTDAALTTKSRKGRYFPTGYRGITDVEVKAAGTPKTLGTDYTVDAVSGRIYIVPTGSIADDSTLTFSCTVPAKSYEAIAGGTAGLIEGSLRFVGDPAAGPAYEVEVWAVQVSPDGELGFISDDFGNWTLNCKVLERSAEHPGEPYLRITKL